MNISGRLISETKSNVSWRFLLHVAYDGQVGRCVWRRRAFCWYLARKSFATAEEATGDRGALREGVRRTQHKNAFGWLDWLIFWFSTLALSKRLHQIRYAVACSSTTQAPQKVLLWNLLSAQYEWEATISEMRRNGSSDDFIAKDRVWIFITCCSRTHARTHAHTWFSLSSSTRSVL